MQNKPNLVRRRRIANSVYTMNYNYFLPLAGQKNKPNSNPNKPNLKRAKMNIYSIITKDYRKKDDFVVRINKPNFFKGQNELKITCQKIWPHSQLRTSSNRIPFCLLDQNNRSNFGNEKSCFYLFTRTWKV